MDKRYYMLFKAKCGYAEKKAYEEYTAKTLAEELQFCNDLAMRHDVKHGHVYICDINHDPLDKIYINH